MRILLLLMIILLILIKILSLLHLRGLDYLIPTSSPTNYIAFIEQELLSTYDETRIAHETRKGYATRKGRKLIDSRTEVEGSLAGSDTSYSPAWTYP